MTSDDAKKGLDDGDAAEVAAYLTDLWDEFRAVHLARVSRLSAAARTLQRRDHLPEEERESVRADAHKLAGALGTYGFVRASTHAREAELLLEGSAPLTAADGDRLDILVAGIHADIAGSPSRVRPDPEVLDAARGTDADVPEFSLQLRGRGETILVVEDTDDVRALVATVLRDNGYEVVTAGHGGEALDRLAEAVPDLILSDVEMPQLDGLALLREVRANPTLRGVPLLFLSMLSTPSNIVAGLQLGADDYIAKGAPIAELLARIRAKLDRPPVPREERLHHVQTGLLRDAVFLHAVDRETERASRTETPGAVAALAVAELPRLRESLGARAADQLLRQVAERVAASVGPLGAAGHDEHEHLLLLLPESGPLVVRRTLERLAQDLSRATFTVGARQVRVTPSIGFAPYSGAVSPKQLVERAEAALVQAEAHLDLQPAQYQPSMEPGWRAARARRRSARIARRLEPFRLGFQVAMTQVAAVVLPLLLYYLLAEFWVDITPVMYIVVTAALLVTGTLIWIEGLLALKPRHPPEHPSTSYPAATAIIAAYLPNEAATIVETVEVFLRHDYPAEFQVILAYNTSRDLPVEQALRDIADRDLRFVPLRVEGSTSKAQNVNAALGIARGVFTGVFDADHHPDPGTFARAWRWLDSGYDVVQGHCFIRNGDESWVAKLVAVEFESIYAVSHPGRERLHDFGIFGGSNGYWRTELLRETRMHGFMLTEDIDSAMRVVEAGYRIQSDPFLVSRELAPVTFQALWNQRMRWAQGWFQVALKHTWLGLRSRHLSPRQKLGFVHLLLWREIYPWLSVQMFPIVLFWLWYYGPSRVDWFVPIWVLTTIYTLSVGPGQTLFAWLLAEPQIRRRRAWFLYYLATSSIFYTPIKNLIAVVAQIKELMRERAWKVTPRSGSGAQDSGTTSAPSVDRGA